MGFPQSHNIGKQGEGLLIAILNSVGLNATKNQDLETKYDYDVSFQLGKSNKTVEVKFDAMAVKTGNLCIEYHNSKQDKPSGIDVTKADIWCHIVLDGDNPTVWITSVAKLRSYIQNNEPMKKIKNGGDKNANLYLYRLDDILLGGNSIFKRIDNVDNTTVTKHIKEVLKK